MVNDDSCPYTCHQWGPLLMVELSLWSHLGDTHTLWIQVYLEEPLHGADLSFRLFFPLLFFLMTWACLATTPAFHPEQPLPQSSSNDPVFPPPTRVAVPMCARCSEARLSVGLVQKACRLAAAPPFSHLLSYR